MATFDSDMNGWISKVKNRLGATPKAATMLLAEDVRRPVKAGGNMPVQRGNLRNSLEASINGGPAADIEIGPDDMLGDPMGQIAGVVNNAQIGQTISLSFRASYANAQERKHAFVRLAGQKWDQFVDVALGGVKGRYP